MTRNGVFLADLFKALPTFTGPLLFGGVLYLIGLALFSAQGSFFFFVTSIPISIVIIGITSVFLTGDWAYRVHVDIYKNAISLFHRHLRSHRNLLQRTLDILHSDKNILAASVPEMVALEGYFFEMKFKVLSTPSGFYSAVYGHLSTEIYFGVLMALLGYVLGLGIFIVLIHVHFVHSLSEHTLDSVSVHYSRLKHETGKLREVRDLLMLSLKASVAWSTGVADLAILFISLGNVRAVTTLVIVITAAVFGLTLFFLPQWDLHSTISDLKKEERKEILRKYKIPENEDPTSVELPKADWIQLHMELEHLEKLEEWPIHYSVIIEEVVISLIPVLVNYAGLSFFHP